MRKVKTRPKSQVDELKQAIDNLSYQNNALINRMFSCPHCRHDAKMMTVGDERDVKNWRSTHASPPKSET